MRARFRWLRPGAFALTEPWAGNLDDHLTPYVHVEAEQQLAAIRARCNLYRSGAPAIPAAGRVAIIVDDGLATPAPFGSVGRFYLDFHEVSDKAVVAALANSEPLARQRRC